MHTWLLLSQAEGTFLKQGRSCSKVRHVSFPKTKRSRRHISVLSDDPDSRVLPERNTSYICGLHGSNMSRSYRILAFLSLLIGLFAPLTLLAQWRSISTSMPGIVRTNSYGGNIKYKQGTLCIGMDNQIAVSSDLGATWVRTSLG